jgi:hypothetical protein
MLGGDREMDTKEILDHINAEIIRLQQVRMLLRGGLSENDSEKEQRPPKETVAKIVARNRKKRKTTKKTKPKEVEVPATTKTDDGGFGILPKRM